MADSLDRLKREVTSGALSACAAHLVAGNFLCAGDTPLAAAFAARQALFRAEVGRPLHACDWWKIRIATGRCAPS